MPAKPHQMSDSQEKSDDLIAELAKLMASNAQGSEAGPKPSVIKLPPLNEATIQTNPVRIPGMDAPRPAAEAPRPAPAPMASAGPAVRIPGMDRPAGISDPGPGTPPARPAVQFDFGKPPVVAAPVIASEPLANWQAHETPKAVAPAPEPVHEEPVRDEPAPPPVMPRSATVTRFEPKVAAEAAAPAPVPTPAAPPAAQASASDGFNFDFGFGTGGGEPKQPPAPANDPIADLITAELDASDAAPEHPHQGAAPQKIQPVSFNPQPVARPVAPAPQRPVAAATVQIKPVSVNPRPSEGERFSTAPVFARPQSAPAPAPAPAPLAAAPRAELDPMDEIESLIGEAVRVELEAPPRPAPAPQPAPVVPPLNTGFAPRRAQLKDNEPQMQSAEAAILAAAAASGSDVDRVDAPMVDDRPYKRMKVKPPKTSFISSGARQYVGIAVAGTLLLAAGFGLYWVLGMNRDDPTTAPVLTADATPAKVEPLIAPTVTAEPSGSVVFDEINGVAAAGDSETLVSRDETAGASVTEVARAVTPAEEDSTEGGLANRKVRTVTVRPDGTIVSGDEAVAGTEALPVERPNVPEIPGGEMAPSDLLTAAVAETEAAIGADTTASTGAGSNDTIAALVSETGDATTTELDAAAPVEVAEVPAVETTPPVFDASVVAPMPMPRPADRSGLVGGSSRVAAIEPEPEIEPQVLGANEPASTPLVAIAEPAAATPQVSSRGGAYVQLSSQRSEDEAAQSMRAVQSRMGGTLNGASLEIRRVDLGAKGVWYRVVLPRTSFQDATQTCAAIKSNGGDCVAING
jgi:hypothetical protein